MDNIYPTQDLAPTPGLTSPGLAVAELQNYFAQLIRAKTSTAGSEKPVPLTPPQEELRDHLCYLWWLTVEKMKLGPPQREIFKNCLFAAAWQENTPASDQ